MQIEDHSKAQEYLARIGYYRLSAYWYPFRELDATGAVLDSFKVDTSFKWVIDLYAFDKALRLQLLDVLERIEVFVRTGVVLQMGKYDPLAHRDPQYMDRRFVTMNARTGRVAHTDWVARLDDKARTSKEEFASHFRTKYPTSHLPVWIGVELLDFGPLSIYLSGLKWADADAIGQACGAPRPDVFASWVRSLSVVRNVCAHHARLWNKPLVDQPKLPASGQIHLLDHLGQSPYANKRLYAACAIARYLLLTVNPRTKWSDRLRDHIETFPTNPYVSVRTMGFPENWSALDLWQ